MEFRVGVVMFLDIVNKKEGFERTNSYINHYHFNVQEG